MQKQLSATLTTCLALSVLTLSVPIMADATNHPNTLKERATQVTSSPAVLIAQRSRTRRIKFASGEVSAILKDSVIRGTRDIYVLDAQKGQVMTVKISSVEKNAVFDILAPASMTGQRIKLKQEATAWTGKLPESGDYQIVVGGTRGNAKYSLTVSIK
jgi:hypothetical protein